MSTKSYEKLYLFLIVLKNKEVEEVFILK